MKFKKGDIIRDTKSQDVWKVLNAKRLTVKVRCLEEGDAGWEKGVVQVFAAVYAHWEIVPQKSKNFTSLYDKLNGN